MFKKLGAIVLGAMAVALSVVLFAGSIIITTFLLAALLG